MYLPSFSSHRFQ